MHSLINLPETWEEVNGKTKIQLYWAQALCPKL